MPIYVYRCASCSAETEKRQGFSDAPLTTCEACGGALRRVLHAVGVIFKGSGFYSTDYKNGSKAKAADSSKDSGKDGGKADSSGSESKSSDSSAAKSESGTSSSSSSDKASSTPAAASGTKSE